MDISSAPRRRNAAMNVIRRLMGSVFLCMALIAAAAPMDAEAGAIPEMLRRKPDTQKKTPSRTVVAEVNGRKITLAMVADQMGALPPEVGVTALEDGKRFLERFVQTELLFQEALRRKLDFSTRVQAKIRLARRQILIRVLIENILKGIKPAREEEVREYFRANRKRFRRKAFVRLSHLVVRSEAEAIKALREIRGGASFGEVARRRSIFESSRKRGGALGIVRRGEFDRNLEKAAFALPVGEVSGPIKTPVGWQIVRVTERREDADAVFDDVKEEVKEMIFETRRRHAYESLLRKLRREGKTVLYPGRLR